MLMPHRIAAKLLGVGLLAATALLSRPICCADDRVHSAPADGPTRAPDEAVELSVRSDLLSAFWGRDITMRAMVVVPEGVDPSTISSLPICYEVHGFGSNHTRGLRLAPELHRQMKNGYPAMVYVFLDASCPLGHHEFADSVNNGPRGRALVEEFLPAIERKYGGVRESSRRFLTGHSSGGWSVLWLQVNYPDSFGGCWATSPDPVDFRDWSGVDLYSAVSLFRDETNEARPLVIRGKDVAMTVEQYVAQELASGKIDGQIASFDAVFSPRGDDGRPSPMFDRATGAIHPEIVSAWKRYDIGLILRERWKELGPKLKGKLHVWCGDEDTFRLQGAVKLLKTDLTALGSDADVLLVPGRDHGSVRAPHPDFWPNGMMERVHREMLARSNAPTSAGK